MKKGKALVIDDEQIVLDSVKKILLEGNYDAEVTPSGRQGLEWGMQKDYDVVLTDIRMPDIGGMVVLRDLKRAKPMLPVVIITGYANVRSAVQAMKLGASDYLEKPFTPDELLKSVDKGCRSPHRRCRRTRPWLTRRKSFRCWSGRQRMENLCISCCTIGRMLWMGTT